MRGCAGIKSRDGVERPKAAAPILLILDTAAEDGAAGLYERLGYCRANDPRLRRQAPWRPSGDDPLLQAAPNELKNVAVRPRALRQAPFAALRTPAQGEDHLFVALRKDLILSARGARSRRTHGR
jgi:hypothetical protein